MILEPGNSTESSLVSGQPLFVKHYCLECLEQIFAYPSATLHGTRAYSSTSQHYFPPAAHHVLTRHLSSNDYSRIMDGACDRGTVTAAANRLYQIDKDDPIEESTSRVSGFPHDYPSNSLQTLQLRSEKRAEIDSILQHILRKSRVRSGEVKGSALVIRTPPNMTPVRDRYKKQGLTSYDRWGKSRSQRQRVSDISNPSIPETPLKHLPHLYCYCREPEDGDDMIKCAGENCLVGLLVGE